MPSKAMTTESTSSAVVRPSSVLSMDPTELSQPAWSSTSTPG
jgi:hypothetical protein